MGSCKGGTPGPGRLVGGSVVGAVAPEFLRKVPEFRCGLL